MPRPTRPLFWFVASGLLLLAAVIFGIVFVNIPYQDPSPDVQAAWQRNMAITDTLFATAGGCLLVAVVLFLARLMLHKPNP